MLVQAQFSSQVSDYIFKPLYLLSVISFFRRRQLTKPKRSRGGRSTADADQSEIDGEIRDSATGSSIGKPSESQAVSPEEQKLAEKELWSKPAEVEEEKTREDEFTEFLEDLFV